MYSSAYRKAPGLYKKEGPDLIPALRQGGILGLGRLGWGAKTGEGGLREKLPEGPTPKTVAPGGWGAEYPEPVVEVRPQATVISIAV